MDRLGVQRVWRSILVFRRVLAKDIPTLTLAWCDVCPQSALRELQTKTRIFISVVIAILIVHKCYK
jgi:hypothetical protein